MTGDKTREYYSKWKGMMIDFRSKFVLMKRVLGRLMSAKTNSAWGKWYFCTFTVESRRFEVLRCLHFVAGTRIMLWVVSFPILMLRAGCCRAPRPSETGSRSARSRPCLRGSIGWWRRCRTSWNNVTK